MSLTFTTTPTPARSDLSVRRFCRTRASGQYMTDHMVTATWTRARAGTRVSSRHTAISPLARRRGPALCAGGSSGMKAYRPTARSGPSVRGQCRAPHHLRAPDGVAGVAGRGLPLRACACSSRADQGWVPAADEGGRASICALYVCQRRASRPAPLHRGSSTPSSPRLRRRSSPATCGRSSSGCATLRAPAVTARCRQIAGGNYASLAGQIKAPEHTAETRRLPRAPRPTPLSMKAGRDEPLLHQERWHPGEFELTGTILPGITPTRWGLPRRFDLSAGRKIPVEEVGSGV